MWTFYTQTAEAAISNSTFFICYGIYVLGVCAFIYKESKQNESR